MTDTQRLTETYAKQVLAIITENLTTGFARIEETAARKNAELMEQVAAIGRAAAQIGPLVRESKSLRELNDRLAPHGWFVPPSIDAEMLKLVRETAIEKGDPERAVGKLIDSCDDRLAQQVLDRANANWVMKDRSVLLSEALSAHEEGSYGLSIPVLLSQVEGAYRDWLIAVGDQPDSPFKSGAARDIEQLRGLLCISDVVLYEHLGALSKVIPEQLGASVNTPEELARFKARYPFGFLSRHAVMHGIDKTYGSKENSSKAVFVADAALVLFSRFDPR